MAKWMKPSEEWPRCDCGDRVVGIVRYRETGDAKIRPHIVVLVAEESGWRDVEDGGHTLEDCELWTMECDLVQISDAIRSA